MSDSRTAVRRECPEELLHYRTSEHEVDFVVDERTFIEVRLDAASPADFAWFPRSFGGAHLTVINRTRFQSAFCTGITLEDFLLQAP